MSKVCHTQSQGTGHCHISFVAIGRPETVANLRAMQQAQCSVLVQWDPPPYLLPGLSVDYRVTVNNEMVRDGLHTTKYTHVLTKTGTYIITLVAYNETLVGEEATILYKHKGIRQIVLHS